MDTLLITQADIVACTTIEKNIDAAKLVGFISIAQRRHLRQVLGTTLYDVLLDAVDAADVTPLPTNLADLKARLTEPLAHWVLVEAWPTLLVNITNSGLTFRAGQDSTTADYKAADSTLSAIRSTAEFLTADLKAWLQANAADYPSYPATPVTPAPASLVGGVYFPKPSAGA